MINLRKHLPLLCLATLMAQSALFPDAVRAQIVEFILVDAAADQDIMVIEDGAVLDLSQLPEALNIRIGITSATLEAQTESARFRLGQDYARTENFAPYALGGDSGGNYFSFDLPLRTNELTVALFPLNAGQGPPLWERSIYFSVVFGAGAQQLPFFANGDPPGFACKGEVLSYFFAGDDPAGDPLTYSFDPRSEPPPSDLQIDPATGELSGLIVGGLGSSTFFDLEVRVTDPDGYFATLPFSLGVIDCGGVDPLQAFTGVTLIDAERDADLYFTPIQDLFANGVLEIALDNLPEALNLRADINPLYLPYVESVTFQITQSFPFGVIYEQTENVFPYALGGDNQGNYSNFSFTADQFTLSIYAFTENNGQGEPIQAIAFDLNVTADVMGNLAAFVQPATPAAPDWRAFPNPFRTSFTVDFHQAREQIVHLQLIDSWGQKVWEKQHYAVAGVNRWNIDPGEIPSGVYILQELGSGAKIVLQAQR